MAKTAMTVETLTVMAVLLFKAKKYGDAAGHRAETDFISKKKGNSPPSQLSVGRKRTSWT